MSETTLTLPVTASVEQIATLIRQMSQADRKRLLSLVPDLHRAASPPASPRTEEQARTSVEKLRKKILTALNNQPLSSDEPFGENLTLGQYNSLPDKEKASLWDQWEDDTDLTELNEKEVRSDALPAR